MQLPGRVQGAYSGVSRARESLQWNWGKEGPRSPCLVSLFSVLSLLLPRSRGSHVTCTPTFPGPALRGAAFPGRSVVGASLLVPSICTGVPTSVGDVGAGVWGPSSATGTWHTLVQENQILKAAGLHSPAPTKVPSTHKRSLGASRGATGCGLNGNIPLHEPSLCHPFP